MQLDSARIYYPASQGSNIDIGKFKGFINKAKILVKDENLKKVTKTATSTKVVRQKNCFDLVQFHDLIIAHLPKICISFLYVHSFNIRSFIFSLAGRFVQNPKTVVVTVVVTVTVTALPFFLFFFFFIICLSFFLSVFVSVFVFFFFFSFFLFFFFLSFFYSDSPA